LQGVTYGVRNMQIVSNLGFVKYVLAHDAALTGMDVEPAGHPEHNGTVHTMPLLSVKMKVFMSLH